MSSVTKSWSRRPHSFWFRVRSSSNTLCVFRSLSVPTPPDRPTTSTLTIHVWGTPSTRVKTWVPDSLSLLCLVLFLDRNLLYSLLETWSFLPRDVRSEGPVFSSDPSSVHPSFRQGLLFDSSLRVFGSLVFLVSGMGGRGIIDVFLSLRFRTCEFVWNSRRRRGSCLRCFRQT